MSRIEREKLTKSLNIVNDHFWCFLVFLFQRDETWHSLWHISKTSVEFATTTADDIRWNPRDLGCRVISNCSIINIPNFRSSESHLSLLEDGRVATKFNKKLNVSANLRKIEQK